MTAFGALTSRLARFMAIFGAGSVIQLALGLVTTVVVTHRLPPTEFGELALYLLVPSLTMLVCNLATLRGTMHAVFGHGGEDGDVPDEDAGEATARVTDRDPREVLCTGLLLSLLISVALALVLWPLAPAIARALSDAEHGPELVRIGLLGGVFGAQWRVLTNFQRYARKPVVYVVGFSSRAFFVLAAMVVLLAQDAGVRGAMWAYTIGSALGMVVALGYARHDLRLGFSRRVATAIPRAGVKWIPVSLSFHVVQGMGALVVSLYADLTAVAYYSLASSLARIASYAVSTFTYAWGPLLRSPLRLAADREVGQERLSGTLVSGYAVIASFMVLAIGVLADQLVRIAPASFGAAAGLVPVLALSPVGRGWFVAVYTTAVFADKTRWFIVLATSAMFIFVGASWPLGTWLGAYGVGIAGIAAFFVPAVIMLVRAQRSAHPMALDWQQLLLSPLLAAALLVGELALDLGTGPDALLVQAAVVVAYPLLLVATRTIPVFALTALRHPVRLLRGDQARRQDVVVRLAGLSPFERGLLWDALRTDVPVAELAAVRGEDEDAVVQELVALLAQVAGVEVDPTIRAQAERYLLHRGGVASRDDLSQGLLGEGMDPLTLDRLEQTRVALRSLPARRWPPRS